MKITNFIILCVVIVISIPLFSYIFLINSNVLEIRELDTDVTVHNSIGFNLDSDALHFGIVPPGGVGNRNITITNNFNQDCIVNIKFQGEMSDWLDVSENNFELKQNEKKDLKFVIKPPEYMGKKDYNSKIIMIFLKT
jgi:hypothetical protein